MSDEQHDTNSNQPSGRVAAFAEAIARAEGFYVAESIPARAHNPGDLVIPGWQGSTLGAERISVFPSDAEGWRRLWRQLELIIEGKSNVYTLDNTIWAMGQKWAPHDPQNNWAINVAQHLGVSAYSQLRDVLGEQT